MLSLQLKSGEYVTIGDKIAVQVFEQSGPYFRVAIQAPKEVPILRGSVHERSGNRPDGLYHRRPKSPSERRHDAKHFEQWAEKKAARQKQEDAAFLEELLGIADRMDALSTPETQNQISDLRSRLAAALAASAKSNGGEGCGV